MRCAEKMYTVNLCSDLEELFRKHTTHNSEIFCEMIDGLVDHKQHLVNESIGQRYTEERVVVLTQGMGEKLGVLENCVG